MDYADGEDFNGTLLRVASLIAWVLVLAGAVLAGLAKAGVREQIH